MRAQGTAGGSSAGFVVPASSAAGGSSLGVVVAGRASFPSDFGSVFSVSPSSIFWTAVSSVFFFIISPFSVLSFSRWGALFSFIFSR